MQYMVCIGELPMDSPVTRRLENLFYRLSNECAGFASVGQPISNDSP